MKDEDADWLIIVSSWRSCFCLSHLRLRYYLLPGHLIPVYCCQKFHYHVYLTLVSVVSYYRLPVSLLILSFPISASLDIFFLDLSLPLVTVVACLSSPATCVTHSCRYGAHTKDATPWASRPTSLPPYDVTPQGCFSLPTCASHTFPFHSRQAKLPGII